MMGGAGYHRSRMSQFRVECGHKMFVFSTDEVFKVWEAVIDRILDGKPPLCASKNCVTIERESAGEHSILERYRPVQIDDVNGSKLAVPGELHTRNGLKKTGGRVEISRDSLKLLPKDHKPGPLKGRPIVAAVDAPAARLPRFLASELYPLLRQAIPAHLDSTSSFLQAIASVELSSNSEFASLDIVNLYGSIPVEDGMFPGALSIVTQFFDAHRGGTLLAPVTKEDFTALLRLSLTSDTIQVNSKRFKQVSGIQMGNNLSTSVAIIFMSYIEKQIIEELSGRIKLWLRYIDDVFVIFEDISADQLLKTCNDIHPDIVFTIEKSVNNSPPYLDVLVSAKEKHFVTTLYAKPAHSGCVIPWTSHHPKYILINILKNELR